MSVAVRRIAPFLVALVLAAPLPAQQRLGELDRYIEQGMRDWEVPGLAISIVKDGEIIAAKGFGVREIGKPTPVDDETVFAIGSSSKAFTSAAVAMLVDEGKVAWDDPAIKHLPQLQFHDPYVTREITVRDLLSHRSGLPRYDALWGAFEYDRDEVLRRVRYLEPGWSFRSRFGYQNLMFLAAGELVEAVSGLTWDDFLDRRIFTPLGMERSTTSVVPLPRMSNVATPHSRVDDKIVPIPWNNIDNIGPAGSINSSVREMAEWVRLQLNEGEHRGTRLLSAKSVREMHSSQMIIRRSPNDTINPYTHFSTYGLAWFLQDYRGRKVVRHGGNIDGMTALVAMVPEESLGFVILQNLNGSGFRTPLMNKVIDTFLDAPDVDWSAKYLAQYKWFRARAEARRDSLEAARVLGTTPSLPLEQYAGTYESHRYGEARIDHQAGQLSLSYGVGPAFLGDLEHWHYNTFRAKGRVEVMGAYRASRTATVTFALNATGKVAAMTVGGLGEFSRLPDEGETAAGSP